MARNGMDLDSITQRLGGRPGQSSGGGYGGDDDGPGDEGDGSNFNAGFTATLFAAVIAVGGGTFMFAGGEVGLPGLDWFTEKSVVAYQSKLDGQCGKGWKANVPNVDQLHCYLTKSITRLCDRKEYDALLATIWRYEDDYQVWNRKSMLAAFKTIGKAQTQGMQLGLEAAKLDQPGLSEEEQAAQMEKVGKVAEGIMKDSNAVLAEATNTVPIYQLTDDLTVLAKKGYISRKDLGRRVPGWIEEGFAKAGDRKTACPERG